VVLTVGREDVQGVAQAELNRHLTDGELRAVIVYLRKVLDLSVDMNSQLRQCIKDCLDWEEVGPTAAEREQEDEPKKPEPRVCQVPGSGWPECFDSEDSEYGHLCNAVHVFEGIDEDGQLYVRREWGLGGKPPDDFIPHSWGPAYVPESGETLDQVLADLDRMVKKGILTTEERARSEAFYRRLFSE